MASVCERLGFDEEAAVYRKILKDVAKSGIESHSRGSSVSSRASNVSRGRNASTPARGTAASTPARGAAPAS